MVEGERQAAGVDAERTGMASLSAGSGLHQITNDSVADNLWSAPATAGSRVVSWLEITRAGR